VKVADVLPVPPLVIPSWVPELIVQSVRGQYELAVEAAYGAAARECGYFDEFGDDRVPPEFADALSRDDVLRANVADFVRDELADTTARYLPLTCDPRMESVWRELSKRRSSDKFFHPARAPAAATVQEQQDRAMLDLFHTALRCQQQRDKTTATRGEIEQQRNYYLTKANELRADARVMLVHDRGGLSFDMERHLTLELAAQVYEAHASEFYPTSSEMVFERKGDDRARWVALTLVNKFRELFDQPMYGLTATIASLILGREIDHHTVRYWCDRAVKPPKIAP
jgi:hypothetical protein